MYEALTKYAEILKYDDIGQISNINNKIFIEFTEAVNQFVQEVKNFNKEHNELKLWNYKSRLQHIFSESQLFITDLRAENYDSYTIACLIYYAIDLIRLNQPHKLYELFKEGCIVNGLINLNNAEKNVISHSCTYN